MARKLSIQIKLEGGKEIKRELAEMGAAGQQAFRDIQAEARKVGGFQNLDPTVVTAKLKQVGIVGSDAFNQISTAVDKATRTERLVGAVRAVEIGMSTLTSTVKLAALAFGTWGIVIGTLVDKAVAVIGALSGVTEAINKTGEAAAKAGLSIAAYDKLVAALQKGGVSATGIEEALQKISEAADAAKIEQVAAAVKKLQEVMATGSDPRTSQAFQQLLTMAQGIGPVADAAKKALADLGIQLTVEEQKLQQLASSGTQSLQQLAGGFKATVPGVSAYGQALAQLAAGTGTVGATLQAFVRQLEAIRDPAERNAVAFRLMGAAGLEIAKGIQTGAISSKQSIDELTANIKKLSQEFLDTAAKIEQSANRGAAAWERFKQTGDVSALGQVFTEFFNRMSLATEQTTRMFGPLVSKIGELASALGGAIWDTFASAGVTAFTAITTGIGIAATAVGNFASALVGIVWDTIANAGVAAWNAITGAIYGAIEAIAKFLGMKGGSTAVAPAVAAPEKASGGLLGGRGTGTSDSNLAWVSRGEHIMPAYAVRQPGVLAFLEALRRSGGDLSRVLGGLGRFAIGGPVGLPALAGGGANLGTLTLGLPSGGSVSVRASSDVVEELRRQAALAQVRSGGRKPSRYT